MLTESLASRRRFSRVGIFGVLATLVWMMFAVERPVRAADSPTIWTPGVRDPARGLNGRWEHGLSRRRQGLRKTRGRDPGAVLPLLGLVSDLSGEIPVARLTEFVRGVAGDRKRDPLVRSYAAHMLAQFREQVGDPAEARDTLEREGFLLAWQYVGPFDNAGKAGDDATYGPQTDPFHPDQVFQGVVAGEPLGWRMYDYAGLPRAGYISFDEFIQPNEHVVAYATTWVKVARATQATLHLGTGGAYRLWVNGTLAGKGDAYRTPHPLQDAHPVALQPGWNRFLLKVSTADQLWGFTARISAPDGAPLVGVGAGVGAQVTAEPQSVVTNAGVTARVGPARSLRSVLEERWRRRKRPADGLALVRFYRHTRPFDAEDETIVELARLVDERLQTADTAWALAVVDTDSNRSRTALENAIARAGQESRPRLRSRLLSELAWREGSLGLERRARDLFAQARAAAPDDAVIELVEASLLAEDGFPRAALAWVQDIAGRYPESETVQRELVDRLLAEGHIDRGLAVLGRLAATGDPALNLRRIALLVRLGRLEEAVGGARDLAARTPALPSVHAKVAHLEEARGQMDGARNALARALALAPLDPDLHGALGQLALRSVDRSGAVTSFRRSLALRPQQPELRDLLAWLEQRKDVDLLARYGADLATVGARRSPPNFRGKSAGILHHRVAVRVLPNGLSERLDHRIIRILDERGARGQAVQAVAYDPAETYVEVRRARVLRGDGSIEDLGETRTTSLAQAGYRMYYDQRRKQVVFAGLRPGDTLEVAFVHRDVAARNKFDEYFGDVFPLQGTEPRAHVEYVLEAPTGKALHFNVPVSKKKSRDGKQVIYRYAEKDVEGIKPEPRMPGWTEIARFLHVSTYASWKDVGAWYWDLVKDQLVVDEAIRKAVADATRGVRASDHESLVHALYTHVVRNTRYVGLEFGIHGYKPYRTTDVHSRRFGDCKDKASLLKVMLAEAGVESHLVLVRTRDQGTIDQGPASLSVFNHAIVYVPELDLYLDGTAEWAGPTELPANDQGATVLVVEDGRDARFTRIPFSPPGNNRRSNTGTVEVARDGSARLRQTTTIHGSDASAIRYAFQSEEERLERFTKLMGGTFAGVEVATVRAPAIDDIRQPVRLEADMRVPAFARSAGVALEFPVLGHGSSLAQGWAAQARRTHPLVLEVPSVDEDRVELKAPPGFRFGRSPEPRLVKTGVGSFELTIDVGTDRRQASVRSRIELSKHRIEPSQYGDFRDFLREVDAALEQTFELTPEK